MFTGIVEDLGRVVDISRTGSGGRIAIACSAILSDASAGDSVAVNGACLTAVELNRNQFSADLSPETLERTNLGDLAPGALVNLERPLRVSGRLNGHFVLGHVDGTGELIAMDALGDGNWRLRVRMPASLERFIVFKGSVAVDGISLTVAALEGNIATFAIIPHTWTHTALHSYNPGARVNLEADILAKHLEKLLAYLAIPHVSTG
jgi:riboflavin synthase